MSETSLPHDTLLDIFSRVPAKSVGRFRCISKLWQTSLIDLTFINMHQNQLLQSDKEIDKFVFCYNDHVIYSLQFDAYDHKLRASQELEPVELDTPYRSRNYDEHKPTVFFCSCNGILCLVYPLLKIICLWNPCTGEYKKLPSFFTQHPCPGDHRWTLDTEFGLVYNEEVHDYEFIRVARIDSKPGYSAVDVYSLRMDSHRHVKDIPYGVRSTTLLNFGVFVNDNIHWMAVHCDIAITLFDDSSYSVIAFDVRGETFREVPLPCCEDQNYWLDLVEYRGHLCICYQYYRVWDRHIDMWVLEEYGMKESWVKLFRIDNWPSIWFQSFCYTKNGLILSNTDDNFVMYDPESGSRSSLKIRGNKKARSARNYMESLVRLNFNN